MANTHAVKYVDGFVLVVPKGKLKAYRAMALGGGKMWMKHGAVDYKECIGDDLNPPSHGMPYLKFGKMTKLKKGETLVFSYIGYKNRPHRDAVNKKVMAEMDKYANDPKYKNQEMPWDMKRFSYGGFKVIVDGK